MVTVPRLWPNSTIVCLATGPSLTAEDVNAVQGKARVIAVNDAYRLAPWADVLYACDAKWWKWHQGVKHFAGMKYALGSCGWSPKIKALAPDVQRLENTGNLGLELNPSGLKNGRNSGYQAINLAVHLGASRIVLIGYDMQRTNGRTHFFGEHPETYSRPPLKEFLKHFPSIVAPLKARGVEVLNATRETALTCFPRVALDVALETAVAA